MALGGNVAETVGVLDVGSFSAHLVVLERGGTPLEPSLEHKTRLRLDRELDEDGRLSGRGVQAVAAAVADAAAVARAHGVGGVFPLATSSIRDAANSAEIVAEVARASGVRLRFLPGEREAELAYAAARRWYGAAAGPLLAMDIGGGTLEIAAGTGQEAEFARSLRLGARELTRGWLSQGAGDAKRVEALRAYALKRVRKTLSAAPELEHAHVAGCSKVFQQLARLTGARPQREGPYVERELRLDQLRDWIPRLAVLPPSRRAKLPGISRCRAGQALAGAVVAEALLTVTGGSVSICPWSTRDGLLIALAEGRVEAGKSGRQGGADAA
ncbi:exopolyphosphatase [Amycolatopsis minnesotensis]|uniref:Exopolyphosphatase n=1 Tax=Amycolatopsis minnesotensis TaxID=337894 RepID=A0ABP5BG56_9PSEU